MVEDIWIRSMRDSSPAREGKYIVWNEDGDINIANWSPSFHKFQGWDVQRNQPIGDIQYWAHAFYVEGDGEICYSDF